MLLEAKRTYWKQSTTIRFVKFGDENSKLFQSMATHTKRRNSIFQLFSSSGQCLTSHEGKAFELWNAFKSRLGSSDFSMIHYDLSD
jgi:hypothetical protein